MSGKWSTFIAVRRFPSPCKKMVRLSGLTLMSHTSEIIWLSVKDAEREQISREETWLVTLD